MRTSESVVVPAAPAVVFPFVDDLAQYPRWLPLVHAAAPDPVSRPSADDRPAWTVELRAQVGPFARSKQLRMVRTESIAGELAVFERVEVDGREHARWALRCELAGLAGVDTAVGSTRVTMHLAYDGRLWTAGLLERVLDEEVRRGRAGLVELVSERSTR